MNLQQIAIGVISAVNPQTNCLLKMSTGNFDTESGNRVPIFADFPNIPCQIQPLSTGDIKHMDSLNIQGSYKAVYLNGNWDGIVRTFNRGGSMLVLPDGTVWLVTTVLEPWNLTAGWTKFAMTLQNQRVK